MLSLNLIYAAFVAIQSVTVVAQPPGGGGPGGGGPGGQGPPGGGGGSAGGCPNDDKSP